MGRLLHLLLFTVLILAALRLARDSEDMFVRLASTAIAAWIGVQTLLNLGAVLGLMPITGVPRTGFDWPVVPEGLTDVLTGLRDRYGDALPPMYVTENGTSVPDRKRT